MTNFHNKINQYLTNKYVSNLSTSEECDKVYDKRINLELNTLNLVKAENTFTFCNMMKQTNINYKNFKLDLTSNDSCSKIKSVIKQYGNGMDIGSIFCFKFSPFFKAYESLNNFMKIVDYNISKGGRLVISFIDYAKLNEINKLYIRNNEIMYYINDSNNDKDGIFNYAIKYFINGVTNESDSTEYVIKYDYLLDYMTKCGYNCIESELYDNLYKVYKNMYDGCSEHELNSCPDDEIELLKLYRYCVFEKIESNVKSVINMDLKNIKHVNVVEQKSHLIKNGYFYRIHCSYDIYNVLNCINCMVFKNMYKNIEIKSYDDIKGIFNELKMDDKCIPYFEGQQLVKKHMIYFYNYYSEEFQEDNEEPIVMNQFYIILYKNNVIQSYQDVEEINELLNKEIKVMLNDEMLNDDETGVCEMKNKKIRIKKELMEMGGKVTMNILKEYLKELELKVSGKKDDLMNRLNSALDI